jgi:hypothetical protein
MFATLGRKVLSFSGVEFHLSRACLTGLTFWIVSTGTASAHVKWFCAYNVAGQPRGLESVLCEDFELLVVLALLGLYVTSLVECSFLGEAISRALDGVTGRLQPYTELMIRIICGFFFVSIWAVGGILLTPELKSTSPVVSILHLLIAAGVLSRRTMPISAVGIGIVFIIAVRNYGLFHLADYPIFLGIAAYLALTSLQRTLFGLAPLDVVRYAAGATLMWASVEKWAYPEWAFPLFGDHPNLAMGFDREFYMRAAGVVEFALAFALIWTPLLRRCAAATLLGFFISACFEFGKIDTIGHSAIIAILFAILLDNRRIEKDDVTLPLLAPAGFCAALVVVLFIYYAGHAALFNTVLQAELRQTTSATGRIDPWLEAGRLNAA